MAGADARAPSLSKWKAGVERAGRNAVWDLAGVGGGRGSVCRATGALLRSAVSPECCAWAADRGCLDWCWGP
eukprot:4949218-Prymnesium_polylepis.1